MNEAKLMLAIERAKTQCFCNNSKTAYGILHELQQELEKDATEPDLDLTEDKHITKSWVIEERWMEDENLWRVYEGTAPFHNRAEAFREMFDLRKMHGGLFFFRLTERIETVLCD